MAQGTNKSFGGLNKLSHGSFMWLPCSETAAKVRKARALLAFCYLLVIFLLDALWQGLGVGRPIGEPLIQPIHSLLMPETWLADTSGWKP